MGSKEFGNPLTDLKIISAIPNVATDMNGVNSIISQIGMFNRLAALSITRELENHVNTRAFPAKQREIAIQTIRTAAAKQIR